MNHFSSGGDVYARLLPRDLEVSSRQAFSGCSAKGVELSRSEESDGGGPEEHKCGAQGGQREPPSHYHNMDRSIFTGGD
jgi:hypothetical protein